MHQVLRTSLAELQARKESLAMSQDDGLLLAHTNDNNNGDDVETQLHVHPTKKAKTLHLSHPVGSTTMHVASSYGRDCIKPTPHAKSLDFIRRTETICRGADASAGVHPSAVKHDLLLMDGWGGGKFRVPDQDYDEFLQLYAEDIIAGAKLYISEQRSSVFKMHIDLDLLYEHGRNMPSRTELVEMCVLIQQQVKRFYDTKNLDPNTFSMIILTTKTKRIIINERTAASEEDYVFGTKAGVHLIFNNLFVDTDKALTIRETLLCKLSERYPDIGGGIKPWTDILDHLVYVSNGLRMAYSSKAEICPSCRGMRRGNAAISACARCGSRMYGKIDTGRSYDPMYYINSEGVIDEEHSRILRNNVFLTVASTSIRCPSTQKPTGYWIPYPGAPFYDQALLHKKRRHNDTNKSGAKQDATASSSLAAGSKKRKRQDINDECGELALLIAPAQAIVRKYHKAYAHVQVKNITRNKNRTVYTIYVDGEGSTFCLNLKNQSGLGGSTHRGKRIYFVLDRGGVFVRCGCKCDTTTDRLYGPCKNFRGLKQRLSMPVKKPFFPDASDFSASALHLEGFMGATFENANIIETELLQPLYTADVDVC